MSGTTEQAVEASLRARRNRTEMWEGDVPLHEYPGPDKLPPPPKGASARDLERYQLRQSRFEINKVALLHYKKGMTEAQVNVKLAARYGVQLRAGTVWRMAERAKKLNPETGRIYGFWACVPNFRSLPSHSSTQRPNKKSRNPTYLLSALFDRFPDIEAKLIAFVVNRTTGLTEMRKVGINDSEKVWKLFVVLCREKNLHIAAPPEWPFTTAKRGSEAIRRWAEQQRFLNPSKAALNLLPANVAKALKRDYAGVGLDPVAAALGMAYSRVELDEHEMDEMWTYLIQDAEGNWFVAPNGRMWVTVMVETESGAALAGTVAFGPSFRKEDVLQTVYSALVPPARPAKYRLDDPEWRVPPEGLFPAELPGFERCTWQQIALDQASAHRAPDVQNAIEDVTGCIVSHDMPEVPTARPIIELFFKTLAKLAEWFESAVGNNPNSPARRDPVNGAVRSLVYVPLAHELLQIVLRIYNATPKKSLGGDTPNEYLQKKRARNECFVSQINAKQNNLYKLLPSYEAELTRRGDPMLGPIQVNFMYATYTGAELANAQELMMTTDTKVDIYPQPDARFAFVVPRSAPERLLRVAVTQKRWQEPHTLEMRQFYWWLGTHKYFKGKSLLPQSGVAASRALAKAASTHEGFAKLVGGHQAFYDLYGNGDIRCIDLSRAQCDELLAWVQKKKEEGQDDGSGVEDETAEAESSSADQFERSDDKTDPYGLR